MGERIVKNEVRCLNNRYKKMACQRCYHHCPQDCINHALDFDLTNCDDCGMCLSICPAEAIAGEGYSPRTIGTILASTDSPLYLSCTRHDKQSSWPCLGFLDARLLLAFVYSGTKGNRQVVVDNRFCFDCKPKVASYLQELFDDLEPVLMFAEKKPIAQGQAADDDKPKEKVVSRRNLVKCLFGEVMNVITEVVQSDGCPEPLPRHKFFANYVDSSSLPASAPTRLFSGISIDNNCQVCGLCKQICPKQAIVIEEHGDVREFYHHALACTGCGVCAANCPQGAITVGIANSLKRSHITTRKLPLCQKCGECYQPIGNAILCLECLLKDKSFKA